MYAAILSGCIPVIFDGGVDDFDPNQQTFWAWRGFLTEFKYEKFAVVYNASEVRSGNVNVIDELSKMPVKDPVRFLSLRRGVDKAAKSMRYSSDQRDAFDELASFVRSVSLVPPRTAV